MPDKPLRLLLHRLHSSKFRHAKRGLGRPKKEEWPFPFAEPQAQPQISNHGPAASLGCVGKAKQLQIQMFCSGQVPLLIPNVVREGSRKEGVPNKTSDALHSAVIPLSSLSHYSSVPAAAK